MKTLASALGAWCLCAPLAALAQNEPCRAESLRGLYVFSASGYLSIGGAMVPKAIVELIRFNGDGTLSVPGATRSVNGTVASTPPGGTGTYDLGTPYPDETCWGRLSFAPSGPHFDIFVSPRGNELWMIQTDAGNVFQGRVTKVAQQ